MRCLTFFAALSLLPLTVLCLVMVKNLLRTRIGRALVAVRDQDIAAGAVGVHVGATKIKSFATSAFIVSFAGALFAYYLSNVSQDTFSLELAIQYVAMVIIGGMGSLLGCVLGALLWQLLPHGAYWLLPSAIGVPVVIGAVVRHRDGWKGPRRAYRKAS